MQHYLHLPRNSKKKVVVKCIDIPQLQVVLRLNLVEDVQIHKCMLDLLFLFKKKKNELTAVCLSQGLIGFIKVLNT